MTKRWLKEKKMMKLKLDLKKQKIEAKKLRKLEVKIAEERNLEPRWLVDLLCRAGGNVSDTRSPTFRTDHGAQCAWQEEESRRRIR